MINENCFNKNTKNKGLDMYNTNQVKYLYEFNNTYYSKVRGTQKPYYIVSINKDNSNSVCSCECHNYCKHICYIIIDKK